MQREIYLGDGCYASFDGYQIRLRAPRKGGDHVVFLEQLTLDALFDYVKALREQRADEASATA